LAQDMPIHGPSEFLAHSFDYMAVVFFEDLETQAVALTLKQYQLQANAKEMPRFPLA